MSDFILDSPRPGVSRITFNRPESLNAFQPAMYIELLAILERIARDPAVRVLVLTGAGRGFCGGHDTLAPSRPEWVARGIGITHARLYFFAETNRVCAALRALPQVTIAAVNGAAAGVGYSLALACDMAVAAKSAKFVNAFHNAGTGSELGLSYMLPRAVGMQRAAELLLTARPVGAEEAERIGLVLRSVDDAGLMDAVHEIASQVMLNAPLDIWLTKQNLYANLNAGSLEQATMFETRAIAMVNATEDAGEKRLARKENRPPAFRSR
jgi:enoyl-CoA hydratase